MDTTVKIPVPNMFGNTNPLGQPAQPTTQPFDALRLFQSLQGSNPAPTGSLTTVSPNDAQLVQEVSNQPLSSMGQMAHAMRQEASTMNALGVDKYKADQALAAALAQAKSTSGLERDKAILTTIVSLAEQNPAVLDTLAAVDPRFAKAVSMIRPPYQQTMADANRQIELAGAGAETGKKGLEAGMDMRPGVGSVIENTTGIPYTTTTPLGIQEAAAGNVGLGLRNGFVQQSGKHIDANTGLSVDTTAKFATPGEATTNFNAARAGASQGTARAYDEDGSLVGFYLQRRDGTREFIPVK